VEGDAEEGGAEEGDVAKQMRLGLEFVGEHRTGGGSFIAPLFRLGDIVLQRMVESGVDFTVVGKEAWKRARPAGACWRDYHLPTGTFRQFRWLHLDAFVRTRSCTPTWRTYRRRTHPTWCRTSSPS